MNVGFDEFLLFFHKIKNQALPVKSVNGNLFCGLPE